MRSAGRLLWVFLLHPAGSTSPDQQRGGAVGRSAGELLPASALVAEHNSSPRGSAVTGRLRRCCEGIPGCAQANGMGSFSGQHLDLDVTRGASRFHDAVRALVGAAQEAAGVPDKIFHRPDMHPDPLARGEGELRLLVQHPVANDVHGGVGRAKGGRRERDVSLRPAAPVLVAPWSYPQEVRAGSGGDDVTVRCPTHRARWL